MEKVLLVEDNLIFRESFKKALLTYMPALNIAEAANGVQALRLVQESCPQVIFMDLKLPGENGIELTKKMRQLAPEAKIIILTIHSPEPEYVTAAQEAGADHFVVKGFWSMEEIVSLITGELRQSSDQP